MSLNRNILRDSVLVTLIGILSQAVGFLIPMLVALKFGASIITDAYYLAVAIPVLFISIIVGGSIRLVFIPVFIEERVKSPESSSDIIAGVAMALLGLSTVLMILVGLVVRQKFFTFAASSATASLAADLSILLLPLIPLTVLFNLYVAVYQSHQRFVKAELATTVKFIIQVGVIWLFADRWGIQAVVLGQLAGQAVAITLVMLLIRFDLGINPLPRFVLHPGLSRMLRLSGLAFLAFVIVTFNVFSARMLAGLLPEGNVTILSLAQRMAIIPSLLISASVGTVVTSYWAKELAEGRWDAVRGSFTKAVSIMWMAILPISAGLFLLRQPLVNLLFQRGAFSMQDAIITATVFAVLAIEVIPVYLHNIIVRILHAQKALKELLWISIGGFVIGVGMMVFLSLRLGLGVVGIVLGVLCGTLFVALTTATLVQARYGLFMFRSLLPQAAKAIIGVMVMAAGVHFYLQYLPHLGNLDDFARIVSAALIGVLLYGVSLRLLRHEDLNSILGWLMNKDSADVISR